AVPRDGLDVDPDVEMTDVVEAPHRDMAEDDLAVGRGRSDGGEGAAVLGGLVRRLRVGRLLEAAPLQAGRGRLEVLLEEVDLDAPVEGADVDGAEGAALELGPAGGGAVGDALHLLEELAVVAAQEEGVDEQPLVTPGLGGGLGAAGRGEGLDVV